jgi:hypothetical protein
VAQLSSLGHHATLYSKTFCCCEDSCERGAHFSGICSGGSELHRASKRDDTAAFSVGWTCLPIYYFRYCDLLFMVLEMTRCWPNKSPEPTAVTPGSFRFGFLARHAAGRRWLSFIR